MYAVQSGRMTNLIATWSFAPMLKGARLGSLPSKYDLLCFLYLTEKCVESSKFLGEITIYTDSIGEALFTAMGIRNINCYDGIYNEITEDLWAYPKILTYEQQSKPYIHIDLDFVFKRSIEIPKCDLFVQCKDTYEHTFVRNLSKAGIEYPNYMNELIENSWTVGILGMFDMGLNREYSKESRKWFEENNNTRSNWQDVTATNTILEQQLLAHLAKDYNIGTLTDKEEFYNEDFRHYVSYMKKDNYLRLYCHNKIGQRHYNYLRILNNAIHSNS